MGVPRMLYLTLKQPSSCSFLSAGCNSVVSPTHSTWSSYLPGRFSSPGLNSTFRPLGGTTRVTLAGCRCGLFGKAAQCLQSWRV